MTIALVKRCVRTMPSQQRRIRAACLLLCMRFWSSEALRGEHGPIAEPARGEGPRSRVGLRAGRLRAGRLRAGRLRAGRLRAGRLRLERWTRACR
jgi:hypothetical protein